MSEVLFLDHNSTSPVSKEVLEFMLPYFSQHYGNASSKTHAYGWVADKAIKTARHNIAELLGCSDQEILFTSGSTEALNIAIKGVWEAYSKKGNEIVTVATEHKAVLDCCAYLETKGAKVTYLGVDANGRIDPDQLERSITAKTILVAVMLANNETGVIQDVAAISQIVHSKGSLFLSDTTQAWGKINVDIHKMGIDLCSLSAHKFYGPKGVGALYVRRKDPRVILSPFIHGGGHEHGLRSGTLNVPGIAGLGKALQMIPNLLNGAEGMASIRKEMENKFVNSGKIKVNGADAVRLPNTSNFTVAGKKANDLITQLPQYAFSTGSACTSADMEPSHVLKAMGITDADSHSTVRISLGINNSAKQIQKFTEDLLRTL